MNAYAHRRDSEHRSKTDDSSPEPIRRGGHSSACPVRGDPGPQGNDLALRTPTGRPRRHSGALTEWTTMYPTTGRYIPTTPPSLRRTEPSHQYSKTTLFCSLHSLIGTLVRPPLQRPNVVRFPLVSLVGLSPPPPRLPHLGWVTDGRSGFLGVVVVDEGVGPGVVPDLQ